jgi:hypothetical protein
MEHDRIQYIEFLDSNGNIQFKLKVGGCLLGIFDTQSEASAFVASPEGEWLSEKAKTTITTNEPNEA